MTYTFNLRDLSKLFQGIIQITKESLKSPKMLAKLWIHEGSRVFKDRLTNEKDRLWFQNIQYDFIKQYFGLDVIPFDAEIHDAITQIPAPKKKLKGKIVDVIEKGYKLGDKVKGKVLHAKYSRYMQQIADIDPELIEELSRVGARFSHHSSIAPTGTISLSMANNASNGIEPSFAHHYARNVIREGRKTKEKVDVFSYELLAYREVVNANAMPYSDKPGEQLPANFVTSDSITPKQHVDIQAAAQKWVDSSISKPANVPTDSPYEDFKDIYMYAYDKGLKGCTTFRFNPEAFQGVLVQEKDLENTLYEFTLDDGSKVTLKGNEQVEYDGELHNAANLFDALKEGTYGKY